MPKLVWLDTGLVNYAAQVQKEVLGAKDIMDAWRGMIAEQIVAQELLTLTDKVSQKRCFWVRNKSGSNAEVDYVWVQDSMVYPIEVKSGHNAHLRSLHSFMNHSNQTVAVSLKIFVSFNDGLVNFSGDRIYLFHIANQSVIFLTFLFIFEFQRTENIHSS